MWAITALHKFLSNVILRSVSPFVKHLALCSGIHSHKLIRHVIPCFPLSLLIHPPSSTFSKSSFRIMCPRNYSYFPFILGISSLFVTIFFKTSSLLACSVHRFLSNILRKKKNSVVLRFIFRGEILQYSLLIERIVST